MPVERLPIAFASRLIGDPGLEIGMGGVRVIVLVMLAVVPVVLLVGLAVRGLPPVVDMDVVVRLDFLVELLMVFGIVLLAPLSLTSLRLAVIFGAIRFAVIEVRGGVVVLGVLAALIRSRLPGQHRRSHEHHCRQQPQKHHQPSQPFFSFLRSTYTFRSCFQRFGAQRASIVTLCSATLYLPPSPPRWQPQLP